MTREEIYEAWAPPGAVWSPWVKPVLFAHMSEEWIHSRSPPPPAEAPPDMRWVPEAREGIAMVVDLPGEQGVAMGLSLAELSFRPVPLYNAAPGPSSPADALVSLVDVGAIMDAILAGTARLSSIGLPLDAPPAFLLDADRRVGVGPPSPGRFDNRSISFVTDFPSANFLLSRSIRRVIVVQTAASQPQADLAHTLRRWQKDGVEIVLKRLDDAGSSVPCALGAPSRFDLLWGRFLALLGLRRSPLGGFGGMVPTPSSG
jgi:hypothetical protein